MEEMRRKKEGKREGRVAKHGGRKKRNGVGTALCSF